MHRKRRAELILKLPNILIASLQSVRQQTDNSVKVLH